MVIAHDLAAPELDAVVATAERATWLLQVAFLRDFEAVGFSPDEGRAMFARVSKLTSDLAVTCSEIHCRIVAANPPPPASTPPPEMEEAMRLYHEQVGETDATP